MRQCTDALGETRDFLILKPGGIQHAGLADFPISA
jgi:hypothetical protein